MVCDQSSYAKMFKIRAQCNISYLSCLVWVLTNLTACVTEDPLVRLLLTELICPHLLVSSPPGLNSAVNGRLCTKIPKKCLRPQ